MIGERLLVHDDEGNDLGRASLTTPVWPGDVIAFETGPPPTVVAVVRLEPDGNVDYVVEAEPAHVPTAA